MELQPSSKPQPEHCDRVTLWPDVRQIGNYLSDYFRGVAQSIATGQKFHNERRTLNHTLPAGPARTFYSTCLPASLDLSTLPRVKPRGRWDWMVYSRQTQLFWRSMQPLVHKVVGDALTRCGLRPEVRDAVLHSRCANFDPNPDPNPNPSPNPDPTLIR